MIPFKYPASRGDSYLEFYDEYVKPLFEHDLIDGNLHLKEPRIMTKMEEEIVRGRFGVVDDMDTYAKLGKHYKLSPERIRQYEMKLYRRLRHPMRKKIVSEMISGKIIPKIVYNDEDVMKQHVCDNPLFDYHCRSCFNKGNINTIRDIIQHGQSGIRRKLFGGKHVQSKVREVLKNLGIELPYHEASNDINFNKAMNYISKIDDIQKLCDLRLEISNILAEKIK